MFLINSASDCQVMNKIQMINPFLAFNLIFFNINIFTNNIIQMAKIGLWIFSGGLLIFGIVGGICCCLQANTELCCGSNEGIVDRFLNASDSGSSFSGSTDVPEIISSMTASP